jgi:hypothetical protein
MVARRRCLLKRSLAYILPPLRPVTIVLGLRLQVAADDLQLVQAAGLHNGARAVPSRDPGGVCYCTVQGRRVMFQCGRMRPHPPIVSRSAPP